MSKSLPSVLPVNIANMILQSHSAFQASLVTMINTKTSSTTPEMVMDRVSAKTFGVDETGSNFSEGTREIDRRELMIHYSCFRERYEQLWSGGVSHPLETLKEFSKAVSKIVVQSRSEGSSSFSVQQALDIMAYLFAYWTVEKSKDYFSDCAEAGNDCVMRPHCAQVISILLLLGLENGAQAVDLKNHLIEIGTGEGKSITLAIGSIMLALMGYSVDCVCYSEYLSQRDFKAFESLVTAFGVRDFIQYGTFNQMCENFINKDGNIRQLFRDRVSPRSQDVSSDPASALLLDEHASMSRNRSRPRVLLIDEVDVFFKKDFFGKPYVPVAQVTDNTKDQYLLELVKYLWSNRNKPEKLKLRELMRTEKYLACVDHFGDYSPLFEEAVKNMLDDLMTFETDLDKGDVIIKDGKVAYRTVDSFSTSIVKEYKTMFTYFLYYDQEKVTETDRDAMVVLNLKCGAFSYAEIPKYPAFSHILGVTGTLADLSNYEKRFLTNDYNITKHSFMPSAYGNKSERFDIFPALAVSTEDLHFQKIAEEVQEKISLRRPVLVFFEDRERLDKFRNSTHALPFRDRVSLLTDSLSVPEKDNIVLRAGNQEGAVTLCTRVFGRGTDFRVFNDHSPGIHVIQAFMSDELAEETQVKGRTARQGSKGSYRLIVQDLERFQLSPEVQGQIIDLPVDAPSTPDPTGGIVYTSLNPFRNAFNDSKVLGLEAEVQQFKSFHQMSLPLIGALTNKSSEYPVQIERASSPSSSSSSSQPPLTGTQLILSILKEFNASGYVEQREAKISRTLFLVDATGSMGNVFKALKDGLSSIFDRAFQIQKDKNDDSIIDMQIALYRNYSSNASEILVHSNWSKSADQLKEFMKSNNVSGGQGHEAVEIGLAHAVAQHEDLSTQLNQIILIGDAGPNDQKEVDTRRSGNAKYYGPKAAQDHPKFAEPKFWKTELQKLQCRGVKIFSVAVRTSTRSTDVYLKECFQSISEILPTATDSTSSATPTASGVTAVRNSRYTELDLSTTHATVQSTEKLSNLVCESILDDIGGEEFVQCYRSRFSCEGHL